MTQQPATSSRFKGVGPPTGACKVLPCAFGPLFATAQPTPLFGQPPSPNHRLAEPCARGRQSWFGPGPKLPTHSAQHSPLNPFRQQAMVWKHPPPPPPLPSPSTTKFHRNRSQLNPFATYFSAETAIFKPFGGIWGAQMGNHKVNTSQNHLNIPKSTFFGKLPFSPLLDPVFAQNWPILKPFSSFGLGEGGPKAVQKWRSLAPSDRFTRCTAQL